MKGSIARWTLPLGLAATMAALLGTTAFAGTTGKIVGRAFDSETGEILIGATIFIEGTKLGALTGEDGRFQLLNLEAGEYTIRARMLGYRDYVVRELSVLPDFTTEVEMRLVPEALQQSEVVVTAERPLIQKDATGTTRFISAEELAKQPIRGYRDAAAQQTGVVNFQQQIGRESNNQNTLIVRGGRPGEVEYFVDGFSQRDPLTGTASTSINNDAIEEIVVLNGGFNAEYGRIMSGAVNVVTKEGGSRYFGSLEAISDIIGGDWINAPRSDYNVYAGSFGGPVLPNSDRMTFYFSGERRWFGDRAPASLTSNFQDQLSALNLNNERQPNNSSSGWTWQGKLTARITDDMNVKLGTLGSTDDWREYVHPYLYNLDHSPRYDDQNWSLFGEVKQALSTTSFWSLGANYFSTERKRGDGVSFDNLNPVYQMVGQDTVASVNGSLVNGEGGYYRASNPRFDTDLPMFWDEGHVWDDYLQREASYWGVAGNFTTQPNNYHELKFGADFQYHTLRFFQHYFPIQLGGANPNVLDFDSYGYSLDTGYQDFVVRDITDNGDGTFDTTFTNQSLLTSASLSHGSTGDRDDARHPKVFSIFAQDKYEREGVIVNGGLRLDYINVDAPALANEEFPLGDPSDPTNAPDELNDSDLQQNKTYTRVSPRVGVAFPVDERTLLRVNYGQFFQQPNLQDLYVSYRFLEHKVRTGGYFVPFGNPNLRPERTTAYEVGVARQLGNDIRVDVTAYWKDVKDLAEVTNIPSSPNSFASFRNRDFATIKGVDIGFKMRPINHISADVNYSLSYAKGTGSVSTTQQNIAWTASQTPKQTSPLAFDQRHRLTAGIDWRLLRGEGPVWGNVRPLENFGINLLFSAGSGTPFTPTDVYNEVTLAAVASQPSGPLNSRYGPAVINLDLKVNKAFPVRTTSLNAYIWVLNVLGRENATTVYTSSGNPYTTNWLSTSDGAAYLETAESKGVDGEELYRLAENNPVLYSNPRQVRFGLRWSF